MKFLGITMRKLYHCVMLPDGTRKCYTELQSTLITITLAFEFVLTMLFQFKLQSGIWLNMQKKIISKTILESC